MASKLSIFAKILILLIFILAGVDKFQNTEKAKGYIHFSLNKFEGLLAEHKIVDQLPYKELLDANATYICYGVGAIEVLCPILILGACNWFAYILFFMLLTFNAVVHNPLYKFDKPEMDHTNLRMFFMNSMIMAGLLMVAGSSTEKKDVVEIEESSSKADVKQSLGKSSNNNGKKKGNKTH